METSGKVEAEFDFLGVLCYTGTHKKEKEVDDMKRMLACVLLVVFLLAGCGEEEKLIGKWEREGDTLILNTDSTGDLSGNPITWMYANDELQVIYTENYEVNAVFKVEFDGRDKLKLTSEGEYGMVAEFTRVED